ncbi:MAG: glycosyl hydrolase [Planctomycetota bacterium]|nr:MAG: glycosyl hydrolase [Planctomycetota bacterium]
MPRTLLPLFLFLAACSAPATLPAQENAGKEKAGGEEAGPLTAAGLAGLKFRSIGPAFIGGRIADLAVEPGHPERFWIAVASGGVWRTENAGTTWRPVFDDQGSYSIGCLAMEPGNPNVVWVGTGENNSQRSVSFGDGVYRTRDGGKSWENLGLKESEHIGMIAIDPRDPNTVFVAAQGPLWRSGGDRGLYKTTDGGATWRRVLHVDDDTGVNEVHLDPRDPDRMYASSYQRRRHVWTLINGGPGSTIWKSEDGGETWRKIERGLPKVDKGRIGLAVAPADPDRIYAIVEAAYGEGGVFRSDDRGESWRKVSSKMTSSPQYYNELVCDPHDPDRLYLLDTFLQVSEDGGATWKRVPGKNKHVDNHALWIDPADTDHLLVGCDGGVYESWDRGRAWEFKSNLPIGQFYRVSADDSRPFYYVYGGTQDNNSMGGPSRTTDRAGITNADWFVTVGGDGYEALAEPGNPDIVYTMWQYGGLVRYDRRSGERVDIKPREGPGEEPVRWNWDSPLIISPHSPTRLYFAGNVLFRSDDRGDHWTRVSPDLTRRLDRNRLEVMGRVWSVDAVAKNKSTSFYGNIVALSESPLVEGLLYAGTDDGLIQVSEDGGGHWRRIDSFPGVPELSYVSRIEASRHDPDRVWAAFSNHKMGDFRPYLLRSDDRGRTWTNAAGDLPEREIVWSLAEDPVDPELLFAGTEFGVYLTLDGGGRWIRLKGGLPTIAVRDLEIQEREGDLVLGTFGRSIYVLDDYTPLRGLSDERLAAPVLFPPRDALLYVPASRLGGRDGRGSQGAGFYSAPNPDFGALITYWLPEKIESRREARRRQETKKAKEGEDTPYPTWEELRAEDLETAPAMILTVHDESGAVVRRLTGPRTKGFHRVAWDLRLPSPEPVSLAGKEPAPWEDPPSGHLALPGTYTVSLAKLVDGELVELAEPQPLRVVPLGLASLPAADRAEAFAFQEKVARLQRAVRGAQKVIEETADRLQHCRRAALDAGAAGPEILAEIERLHRVLADLRTRLNGDETRSKRSEPAPPAIADRVGNIVESQWHTTSAPTGTERDAYRQAGEAFAALLAELRTLVEQELPALEDRLETAGAPFTPGRLPRWRIE